MHETHNNNVIAHKKWQRDPFHLPSVMQQALQLHCNCKDADDEAMHLVLMRELVNATIGFEELAKQTRINSKSLHRMLSKDGNPTAKNLALIRRAIRHALCVTIQVQVDMLPECPDDMHEARPPDEQ